MNSASTLISRIVNSLARAAGDKAEILNQDKSIKRRMNLKKLVIISGSARIRAEPGDPIPAIQRYDGVFERLLRKYYPDLVGLDILILSPTTGLVFAEDKIGLQEPIKGSWHEFLLTKKDILRLKQNNMRFLRDLFTRRKYEEIYVNVGKELLKMIEGIEVLVPTSTKVTYAQGKGIGPKMSHMKEWLKPYIRQRKIQ